MENKKEKKVNWLISRSNFKNWHFIPNESINKWCEIDEVSLHLTRTAKYQVFIPGLWFYIPSKIKNWKAVLPKRMTGE